MEWQDCKFISIALSNHKVYIVENKSGNIIGNFSYPTTMLPTALFVHNSRTKACLTLTENTTGAIYILHLDKMKSYRLPVKIPAPLQFTITPDFNAAYFVSNDATLYHLDIATLACKPLAQSEGAVCAGIIAANDKLYTIWENNGKGIITVFSKEGIPVYENELSGIPTNISVNNNEIIVTFTESAEYGEGIVFLTETSQPQYLTIQNLTTPYMPHIYPCSITLNKQADLGYVVHEDGGLISVIDPIHHTVHKTFSVGRSITHIHLLPDERFAIATSNMFADLSLLDLINSKLIAISESPQEFSNLLAIV